MSMFRSPTFFVGADRQQGILDAFHKSDQHLEAGFSRNKPLCFHGRAFQKTHPGKVKLGRKDADATSTGPVLLGVADGVSQVEDFGIDASLLPIELLRSCDELAMSQLLPGHPNPDDPYRGPIPLLREAFESTASLGSTTVVLSLLDNSTIIHGKLHPMMAVICVGDCELLVLRRTTGRLSLLEDMFHTDMQRIDGNMQAPLQLARVDARIDPDFTESISLEIIERGSAVHCVSAYEGDIVVMGSDGVFDNLFLDEVVELCNSMLPARPGTFEPTDPEILASLASKIVEQAHGKCPQELIGDIPATPIGPGGKMDDTSVLVAELIEWTDEHVRSFVPQTSLFTGARLRECSLEPSCSGAYFENDEHELDRLDNDGEWTAIGHPLSWHAHEDSDDAASYVDDTEVDEWSREGDASDRAGCRPWGCLPESRHRPDATSPATQARLAAEFVEFVDVDTELSL